LGYRRVKKWWCCHCWATTTTDDVGIATGIVFRDLKQQTSTATGAGKMHVPHFHISMLYLTLIWLVIPSSKDMSDVSTRFRSQGRWPLQRKENLYDDCSNCFASGDFSTES